MALKTIGTLPTGTTFGTGDATILNKEVTVEATTDVACKDGTGAVVAYVIDNFVKNTRETKYGALADVDTLVAGNVRKTASASNEDFTKVTTESRAIVPAP